MRGNSASASPWRTPVSDPPRIHRLDVLVDGVDVSNRNGALIHFLVEACCGDAYKKALARAGGDPVAALGADMTRPVARTFLSPRQEANVLLWPKTEANSEIWTSVDQARRKGRISLRACYCSVFDECWIAQTYTFPPRKVDRLQTRHHLGGEVAGPHRSPSPADGRGQTGGWGPTSSSRRASGQSGTAARRQSWAPEDRLPSPVCGRGKG